MVNMLGFHLHVQLTLMIFEVISDFLCSCTSLIAVRRRVEQVFGHAKVKYTILREPFRHDKQYYENIFGLVLAFQNLFSTEIRYRNLNEAYQTIVY
jgi:hypothetical protein